MTRIFISKTANGWQEVKVPDFYQRYSHDALLSVVHQFIGRRKYKGILFTENPDFSL